MHAVQTPGIVPPQTARQAIPNAVSAPRQGNASVDETNDTMHSEPVIQQFVSDIARRHVLPSLVEAPTQAPFANPDTDLALAIKGLSEAASRGESPDEAMTGQFTGALARVIGKMQSPRDGDPAYQIALLRHQVPEVEAYASLKDSADMDRRRVMQRLNAVAHPEKLKRMPADPLPDALSQLQSCAGSSDWPALDETARRFLASPKAAGNPAVKIAIEDLSDCVMLANLQRLHALRPHEAVQRYESLVRRLGPGKQSAAAISQGRASQQRGVTAEAQGAQALEALAATLNGAEGAHGPYRVVRSMLMPKTIPGDADRAKGEWDAVLLKKMHAQAGIDVYKIALLMESKASPDDAITDFPRLKRALERFAQATPGDVYAFDTRTGIVHISGASLSTLCPDETTIRDYILYNCDAPVEASPRLLSPAYRMQLACRPDSLEFASASSRSSTADPRCLETVSQELLNNPKLQDVLHQYSTLKLVRELMVHSEDIRNATERMVRLGTIDNTKPNTNS